MRNTFTIVLVISILLSMFSCRSNVSGARIMPLVRAHAHNDYEHDRPLYDALAHGFNSVEADIFLVDDDLYVAHNRRDITPERTLRRLYLDPLRERIKRNGGRVFPNGPQFILLIDIKTDAVETYKALDKMLAEYRDIFTSFGPNGRSDKAVLAIISGNRPGEFMEAQKLRYAGYDGRLTDLESESSADFIPMISDRWGKYFTWNGKGQIPAEEHEKLRKIVQKAHEKGRLVRFWATPDNPSPAREKLWRQLLSAGVDLINTDDLEGLRQFLLINRNK
jgi:hypothetical protein